MIEDVVADFRESDPSSLNERWLSEHASQVLVNLSDGLVAANVSKCQKRVRV